MAEFTLFQNRPAFTTIWEYEHNTEKIYVKPDSVTTYMFYVKDAKGYQTEESTGLSSTQLVSALTTKIGEAPTFVVSSQEENPSED